MPPKKSLSASAVENPQTKKKSKSTLFEGASSPEWEAAVGPVLDKLPEKHKFTR
jgi:hypothetical protein